MDNDRGKAHPIGTVGSTTRFPSSHKALAKLVRLWQSCLRAVRVTAGNVMAAALIQGRNGRRGL